MSDQDAARNGGAKIAASAGGRGERSDPWAGKRKLLAVADVQTGYHHDSISHALATLSRIGRESGAFVTNIRTDSQLITRQPIIGTGPKYGGKRVNARTLSEYDALFLLPSGTGTLTAEQKADLLAFVHDDGKGLVIGHAGILAFFEWPEFHELTGGGFAGELMSTARIIVEDLAFPGADAFGGASFEFTEQHPIVKEPYSRDFVHVIMRVDATSIAAEHRTKRPDGDYPVVWSRQYGKGRVFHVGWGHLESTWDDVRFQRMVLGGILWAMKSKPSPAA
ncbi:ThuA domain-containing protein [Lacipirellula sp.]|uniref:ThuA domain-containing protein n=1 Tax=Lacipirellula sp. TaxID=2691419 RepID=UPI003D12F165